MFVTPHQAAEARNAKNNEFLDEVIDTINSKLTNPQYCKDWVCNSSTNPTYRMGFIHTFTEEEKEFLIKNYMAAGWGKVTVTNSADNGERPGAASVVLYTNKE